MCSNVHEGRVEVPAQCVGKLMSNARCMRHGGRECSLTRDQGNFPGYDGLLPTARTHFDNEGKGVDVITLDLHSDTPVSKTVLPEPRGHKDGKTFPCLLAHARSELVAVDSGIIVRKPAGIISGYLPVD